MEFLKENRNIIILIAIIAICYLLFQSEQVKKLFKSVTDQWKSLSPIMKLVVVLIVVALLYNMYDKNEY